MHRSFQSGCVDTLELGEEANFRVGSGADALKTKGGKYEYHLRVVTDRRDLGGNGKRTRRLMAHVK